MRALLSRFDPRRLELRWQLSLAMMLTLSLTLLVAIGIVLRNSRSAVANELDASLVATTDSLDATLPLLDRLRPEESLHALQEWVTAQSASRHLCAMLRPGPFEGSTREECPAEHRAELSVPAWFASSAVERPLQQHREVSLGGRPYAVLLVADPSHELNEAWAETGQLLQLMVLMAFTANALIVLLVTLALRPLSQVTAALARLQTGEPEIRLPTTTRTPDLQRLVQGVQRLSLRLARGAGENRRLLLRNLDLQEDERRMIARELHDEIGQHVTAIEMVAVGLERQAGPAVSTGLARVRDSVAELHRLSRRMIRRLSPAALDTLGLAGGLEVLVAQWRAGQPEILLLDGIDPRCDQIDAYASTHVYRIVQEALSNAIRHGRAGRIEVQVTFDGGEVRLRIADDGCGFDPESETPGLGLLGVRERVKALGGTLDLESRPGAGCRLGVRLPVTTPRSSRRRRPSPLPQDFEPARPEAV